MSDSKKVSSYQKGINRLMENRAGFEWIIANYLIDTRNKFKSEVFPTTQIAKIVVDKMGKKKTQYSIIHKVVREILNLWAQQGICELIDNTSKNTKKTKRIYKFTPEGFSILKARVINFNIENIKGNISEDFEPKTRTREEILKDYLQTLLDEFEDAVYSDEDYIDDEDEEESGEDME
ncbi:MAG: hypothetical protein ACTSU2_13390 [Promethearchaeota archaeon]